MVNDKEMPKGWHTIKSVLLTELITASNFHLCCQCADALFHSRLIGEGIACEAGTILEGGIVGGHGSGEKYPDPSSKEVE